MTASILNYTTKVEAAQTAGEIIKILARIKARRTFIVYDGDGVPESMEFLIDTRAGEMAFRLPSRFEGVHQVLKRDYDAGKIDGKYAGAHHAKRVAWRILRDWVEAQVALAELGVVRIEEIMFAYTVLPEAGGATMFDSFMATRALPAGGRR